MAMVTIRKILVSRLETLRDDFLQRFGETEENERFIEDLRTFSDSMKSGEESGIKTGKFSGLLETLKSNLRGNKFILEFEFSSVMIQIMALERILAAELRRRLGGQYSTDDKTALGSMDSQLLDRLESSTAYMRTLDSMGLESVDRKALGWGAGKTVTGSFTKSAFDLVERYMGILERNQRLKALSEKIGRHSKTRSKATMKADGQKPAVSYDGIYNSDNLKTILPSELALYADKRTRTEFLRRLSDRQVLCYRPAPDRSAADGNDKDKGPVIICLDTSGSMHGIPEAVSKAATLAIIGWASKEKRETLIISFSVKFEVLRISHPEKESEMKKIVDFLSSSFHGGTDIGQALSFAISETAGRKLKNADILTISDFVSSDLPAQTVREIKAAKKRGTRFFAVSMGDRGRTSILMNMDETLVLNRENFR